LALRRLPEFSPQDIPSEQIDDCKKLDNKLLDEYEGTEQYGNELKDAVKSFEEILKKASQAAASAKSSGSDGEDDGDGDEED
jgi:hypothetical protein